MPNLPMFPFDEVTKNSKVAIHGSGVILMRFFQDRRRHFSFESASYFYWCNLLPKAVKELRLLNIFLNSKHFWLMFYFAGNVAFKGFVKVGEKLFQ
jgi:hypothetical protein